MIDRNPAADARHIRPQCANELMKKAQSIRQTVYINGACGCGKTAFAVDYLSKVKYEYYSMADVRLTADICPLQGGAGRIIVIDDMHELQSDDERQAAYDVLSQLARSADCWLILISRSQVPAWLMPLYVECIFVTIGERELCLTDEEGRAYLAKWNLTLQRDLEKSVLLDAQGFPLALRIVAMQLSALPGAHGTEQERRAAEQAAVEKERYNIYDYLETHVYDQWDVELAEFLMDISIVESFDIPMAQLITKKNNVGVLIRRACETGTFLTENRRGEKVSYEMRKPMRKSMRRRLVGRCTKTHIDELYRSAGESYELAGDVTQALAMYDVCGYEEGISRILVENARQHAGSGHYWELRKYYLALPEDKIRESPELMAGMSLLASIMLDDEKSEMWYRELSEYAKRQTGSTKRAAQARLLYLDIALPQRGTGQMTDVLRHAWTFITERKTILPEMSLTNNQPTMMHGGKDFCEWSRRDRELAKKIGKPVEILMGSYGRGLVNLALAESFLEKGEDSYEVSVLAQKGRMQAQAGGAPEQEFVGVGLLAWLSVLTGRVDDATAELAAFRESVAESTPWLLTGIDTLLVRLYLYTGGHGQNKAMDGACAG